MTTLTLCEWVHNLRYDDIPPQVIEVAIRSIYNWLGCAIGGSQHEAVSIAISALDEFSGPRIASILGRHEKFDVSNAALINGISSHVFDFDDTHLKTVIHPAGPVVSCLMAYAQSRHMTGREFLLAAVCGIEVECRIGNAVFPDHYDRGWHITGSTGVFGAAVAIGKAKNLSILQLQNAIGVAASQSVGLREQFGTMTKSFHPGRAAQNGLLAAVLAEKGFTASTNVLEAKRGWAYVLSTKFDLNKVTENLGQIWETELNTFKPFACGIVLHPVIDGCARLRREGIKADDIRWVDCKVHPLVLELTGKTRPKLGLEGKFSYTHACASALLEGKAGEQQFSDDFVKSDTVVNLREKVRAEIDENINSDSARIIITLNDGSKKEMFVEHAIGSLGVPLSKNQVVEKFMDLVLPIIGEQRGKQITETCFQLDKIDNAASIALL